MTEHHWAAPKVARRHRHLLAVARQDEPPDLLLKGGRVVNVYTGEIYTADVAVAGGRVARVDPGGLQPGPATETVELEGRFLAPGLIEPHCHPFLIYNPAALVAGLLPLGVTTVCADSSLLLRELSGAALQAALDWCGGYPADVRWLARLDVPVDGHDGPWYLDRAGVDAVLRHPRAVGVMEFTRWTVLQDGPPYVLERYREAQARRLRVDGHTAGASAGRLHALVAAGLSSCHEAINVEQVIDRLRLGLWTPLRYSSIRPDLPALAAVLRRSDLDTRRVLLTCDSPTPLWIQEQGFLDAALRILVAAGVDPVRALRLATLSPAEYYGLDDVIGGIAPGRQANLVVYDDLSDFRPQQVWVQGRLVAAAGSLKVPVPEFPWAPDVPGRNIPAPGDLPTGAGWLPAAPAGGGAWPVLEFTTQVLTRRRDEPLPARDGHICLDDRPDLLYCVRLDRRHKGITRTVVGGFAPGMGALATDIGYGPGWVVMGRSAELMHAAARQLIELQSGIVVLDRAGAPLLAEPLQMGGGLGLAGTDFAAAVRFDRRLQQVLHQCGHAHDDPIYTLLFLTGVVVPDVRLCPQGVVEVRSGRVLTPAEAW